MLADFVSDRGKAQDFGFDWRRKLERNEKIALANFHLRKIEGTKMS